MVLNENCSNQTDAIRMVERMVEAELVAPAKQSADAECDRSANPIVAGPEESGRGNEFEVTADLVGRSWIFRAIDLVSFVCGKIFGIVSAVFLIAASANIPIVQFASLGFLLEATGRVARGGKWSSGLVGLEKSSRVFSMFFGAWLLLIPLRFFSENIWYEAHLIDPTSAQTKWLRVIQMVLIALTVIQILAAWACGGKLRYFFWQLFAPFSFAVWAMRKLANASQLRPVLGVLVGWMSPSLVDDLCRAKPPTDWFVPAILWTKVRQRRLYSDARDGVWDFFTSMNFPYYFLLGFKGFIGTLAWLVVPTLLLIFTTQTDVGPVAGLAAFVGSIMAIPVFAVLPILQAHFATDGQLKRFFQVPTAIQLVRNAPVAYLVSLFVTLLFAIPLFVLKIEEIPYELLWTLSLVFVIFTWPARICVGLCYRRAARMEKRGWWFVRYPIMSLALPISLAFVVIFFFTSYVTWNGGLSLFENHVFLLPAPFWL